MSQANEAIVDKIESEKVTEKKEAKSKKTTVAKATPKKATTTKAAAPKKEAAPKKAMTTKAIKPKKAAAKKKKKPAKKPNLVIVESPAKAKTIGKVLGKNYRVVASNGHVRDLPKSTLGVDLEKDFTPRYITVRGKGEVLKKIRSEAKKSDFVYLATDPDREGEAISWHLAHILGLEEGEKNRISFNEITPAAIKAAIKEPREIDTNLVNAQQARRILDRLVGYQISPLLWEKVRRGLSAGRVQSVALKIIVTRENEIRVFIPEEYWTIEAMLFSNSDKSVFTTNYYGRDGKKVELNNIEEAQKVTDNVGSNKFVVNKIKKGERKRHPSPPFITSTLQQEAARKLNYTSKKTMAIAQQLYEGVDVTGKGGTVGLITYMRTDSVRVSDQAIESARNLVTSRYGKEYIPDKPNEYKGRKAAQDAHEAIRPSYVEEYHPDTLVEKLSPEQAKLYKLIYDRFIASQMLPARYETIAVEMVAGGETFKANGRRMLFDGFTKVYSESSDSTSDEKDNILPVLEKDEELKSKKIAKEQHFTQPPPRYNEASLIKTLEEKGIGRPSTYSPTISTIMDRDYVERKNKVLFPTELGELVNEIMTDNFAEVVDVEFTAQLEDKLDDVENESGDWKQILRDFYGPFKIALEEAQKNLEGFHLEDEESDIECDKCGSMMIYKYGRFGKFLACPNYPECKNTKAIVSYIDTPCPKCDARLIRRRSKKGGRAFYGCEKYPECDFVSWDYPVKEPCPECGSLMVYKKLKKGDEHRCTNDECKHIEPVPVEQTEEVS